MAIYDQPCNGTVYVEVYQRDDSGKLLLDHHAWVETLTDLAVITHGREFRIWPSCPQAN